MKERKKLRAVAPAGVALRQFRTIKQRQGRIVNKPSKDRPANKVAINTAHMVTGGFGCSFFGWPVARLLSAAGLAAKADDPVARSPGLVEAAPERLVVNEAIEPQ